jgi:gluconokinase
MEYIIGIDIGTSGTKAIAFTKEGQVSESTYESYSIISEISEEQELDPGILLQAVINVVKDLLKAMAGKGQLAGLSFSCAMHSVMAIDEFGTPLTRAITWADLRSRDFAKKLKGTQFMSIPVHPFTPCLRCVRSCG